MGKYNDADVTKLLNELELSVTQGGAVHSAAHNALQVLRRQRDTNLTLAELHQAPLWEVYMAEDEDGDQTYVFRADDGLFATVAFEVIFQPHSNFEPTFVRVSPSPEDEVSE